MQQYFLSLLIFTPLLAAIIILFVSGRAQNAIRFVALGASACQVVVSVAMALAFDHQQQLQFAEQRPWISLDLGSWGLVEAQYFVAVDGLNYLLILLSVGIMFIATIASPGMIQRAKGYYVLLLMMNTAIIGAFSAMDFLLFYLFFEFMLLPMFFLIGLWGGPRREYASIKFFLYTLLGSIFILIAMIALYMSVRNPDAPGLQRTFNLLLMKDPNNFIDGSLLSPLNSTSIGILTAREWTFLLLFAGFAIKLPMVPLHTWLPDAHVEAPTPVSVILAALLLKIGGYGLMRIALPVFPDAAITFSFMIGVFGVVSIIYGALTAMASKDLKRLIAYSSVSHMGFVLLGMSSLTNEGVSGAIYQMFSHGLISALLFLIAGVLSDRTHDRTIDNYSGLASRMPEYFTFVLIGFFASMGLPGFSGFIAEVFVFLGAFRSNSANGLLHESLAIISTFGLVLGAGYYLWTIQRMFFGSFHLKGALDPQDLTPLTSREYVTMVPLCMATIFFGIFPQTILAFINPFADQFVRTVLETGEKITFNL